MSGTNEKFILDGHTPISCPNLLIWAEWLERSDRCVAVSVMSNCCISTVFMGLDHSFGFGNRPILFETMIFGGPEDGYQTRCSTWEEAEEQHALAKTLIIEGGSK